MDNGQLLLSVLHGTLATLAIGHILLNKSDSKSAFGWILMCLIMPLVGVLLYGIFGVNRVERRAAKLGRGQARNRWDDEDALNHPDGLTEYLKPMADAASRISGLPLTAGNTVEHLHTGRLAFPAMLETIHSATQSVYICTYMFDSHGAGQDFIDALTQAHHRGVDVRVLIDGVGDRLSWVSTVKKLRSKGIAAAHFLRPQLIPPAFYLNLRNHRKLMIVDEKVAFAGGLNLTQSNAPRLGRAAADDDHFELRGPVIRQLLAIFAEDWNFSANDDEQLVLKEEPDKSSPVQGGSLCRAIPDGPDTERAQLAYLMLTATTLAKHRITITTPYFLPTEPLFGALCAAALRGVDVRVLIPKKSDHPVVHWATHHWLPRLISFGIEVRELPHPFLHSKLFLVDEDYALFGSCNIDPRSLRLNFELMVEVYDQAIVSQLQEHAGYRFARGEKIDSEYFSSLSLPVRLRNAAAGLLTPYL